MRTITTTTPYAQFEATRYFPSLDGIRAICVLLVMFSHIPANVPRPGGVYGYLGVDVFFVLSGFLITTLLLRERARTGRISLKGFYLRRFLRIVPVYLVTVLLYFVAVHATHDAGKIAQFKVAFPWLMTFMQEYRPAGAGNILGHSWTLGIEEKFYLLWPLILIMVNPARARGFLWLLVLCIAISLFPYMYARSYGGLLIGAVLAFALSVPAARVLITKLPGVPDSLLCCFVAGAYALAGHNDTWLLLFSASVALLMASLLTRKGVIRVVLENRVLVFIGKRSYAMYLIHVLAADSVAKLVPAILPPQWFPVVSVSFLAAAAGASLMYVAIERPCIRYARRISGKLAHSYAQKRTKDPSALPQPLG